MNTPFNEIEVTRIDQTDNGSFRLHVSCRRSAYFVADLNAKPEGSVLEILDFSSGSKADC